MPRPWRMQFRLRTLVAAMLVLGAMPWFVQRYLHWREEQVWSALDAAKQQRELTLVQWRDIYGEYLDGEVPAAAESAARARYFAARQDVASAVAVLRDRYDGSAGGLERAAQRRAAVK